MNKLARMTLSQLDTIESDIKAERAKRAGKPLIISDRDTDIPCPSNGWLLDVTWAVSDQSYVEWYAREEAALAALHLLAAAEGRTVEYSRDSAGLVKSASVELTYTGCHYSGAVARPVRRAS